jgi:hypothetical protein
MPIRTFTSKGSAVNSTPRAGLATSPLGRLDPLTGKVWQHPRQTLERLKGRSVTITNPKASLSGPQATMTRSLGMGGVGQRGRNRDVGSTKARGEA